MTGTHTNDWGLGLHSNDWGCRCCRAITAAAAVAAGASRHPADWRDEARAVNADRCTRRREPVLFSATKSICFSPSPTVRCLFAYAPPVSAGPAARSRPFDPATVLRDHRIAPTHASAVRCCRCAGRGGRGKGTGGEVAPSSRSLAASWATPGARSPPLAARSVPFDPVAVRRSCLFAPLCDFLCRCCCSQGKGRRWRERARSSCTRCRHEKDDKEDKKKVETVRISTN